MHKVNMSSFQLYVLLFITMNGTGLLTAPGLLARMAGASSWMAPFLAMPVGLVAIWLAVKLNRQFPEDNLVGIAEKVAGPVAGRALSLLYLFYMLSSTGFVLRQFSDFLTNSFLMRTPGTVVSACLLLVGGYAVKQGPELLGRLGTMFLPIFISLSLLVCLPMLWNAHIRYALPLGSAGWESVLSGAYALQLWFPMMTFASFYLPYVGDKRKALAGGIWMVVVNTIWFACTNLFALVVLGPAASGFNYPIMTIVRQVQLSEFVEHIDALVMMGWVLAFFVRIVVCLFGAAVGTARWLGLPNYRPLVYPLAWLLVIVSQWGLRNTQYIPNSTGALCMFYLANAIALPSVLLLLSLLRRVNDRSGETTPAGPS
ncbi:GerAB/ArcD/ProY family transporter [Cohnella fermenti]|uniref:Uncharacterized protein n=1 Tax=Cohnella fermenti TaxID=2565925 RepID=A0A4S4BSY7_9BACL|nr:endospore germination permease [Cohnella fermenti]THF75881.1 hypothetical protein E6C55_20470 [Cohnella fermenti]